MDQLSAQTPASVSVFRLANARAVPSPFAAKSSQEQAQQAQVVTGKLGHATVAVAVELTLARTENIEWPKGLIESMFRELAAKMEIKLRDLLPPFYVPIGGRPASTPLFDSMEILGRDISRMRLRHAFTLLSGPKSEEKQRWRDALLGREEKSEEEEWVE